MPLFRRTAQKIEGSSAIKHGTEIDHDELFIASDVEVFPARVGGDLVFDRHSGRIQSLPSYVSGILPYCSTWRTLRGHFESLLQRGWAHADMPIIEGALGQLAALGLLLSKKEFLRELTQRQDAVIAPGRITSAVWCTRDRPDALKRSLESFARNNREHDRTIFYHVFYDAKDRETQRLYRDSVASLNRESFGSSLRIYSAGEDEKRKFAAEIVRKASPEGLPPEVVDFALSGLPDCDRTYGAGRNLSLLATCGEMVLGADDDTVCRFARPRQGGPSQGLQLSSSHDPTEFYFFSSRKDIYDQIPFEQPDILARHEELLGKSVARCVADAARDDLLELERCGSRLCHSLLREGGKIMATVAGICGDSGQGGQRFILGLRGESRERLMASAATYTTAQTCREALRIVTHNTVSEGAYCMSINIGLDNRDILPPFFPIGRNEDGILGQSIRTIIPGGYLGYIPWAVLHDPIGSRQYDAKALRGFSLGISELIIMLLQIFEPAPRVVGARERLARTGRFFLDLAAMENVDFLQFLRRKYLVALGPYFTYLEDALRIYDGTPPEWAEDVNAHLGKIMEMPTAPDFCIPTDLREGRTEEEALDLMKRLVGRYGELMIWWPVMREAARQVLENREAFFTRAR